MKKWIMMFEGKFEYKSDPGKNVDENIEDFLDGISYEGTDIKNEYGYELLDDGILLIEVNITAEIFSDSSDENDAIVGFVEALDYEGKAIKLDCSVKCKS